MIRNFKNSDLILNGRLPLIGQRIDSNIINLLRSTYYVPEMVSLIDPDDSTNTQITVEFHVYTNDGNYLASNHNVKTWKPGFNSNLQKIDLDIHSDIQEFGFVRGTYKFNYNFHLNLLGGVNSDSNLFIYDISPSRRELILKLGDIYDQKIIDNLYKFVNQVNQPTEIWKSYILNFGSNKIINILNTEVDLVKKEIYIRLFEPLPSDILVNTICSLSSELLEPYIDKISIIPIEEKKQFSSLRGPNFDIDTDYTVNQETGYKNWNQLVASGSTSQQVIESLFSSEVLQGARINIDYSDFKNFIHFSSAEERIENFVYKLQLLETYDSRLSDLRLVTGSYAGELQRVTETKNKVIKGLDDFEKYLYFGYSGSLYSYPGTASVEPHPKYIPSGSGIGNFNWYNSYDQQIFTNLGLTSDTGSIDTTSLIYPFKLIPLDDSRSISWYQDAREKARVYDKQNLNALRWSLPGHIVDDSLNESAVLFMDMLGHHYDILWAYIKAINNLNSHEEHIKDGTSPDLLYHLAKSFGWTLTNGKQTKELWETFLGPNKEGVYIQSGSMGSKILESDLPIKQVWKRIVNNLPNILKQKGSSRSVKALIASYGIPNSILFSKEYGGPSTTKLRSDLKLNKYQYALKFNSSSIVSIPFKQFVNTDGSNGYTDNIFIRLQNPDATKYKYDSYKKTQTIFSKVDSTGSNLFHLAIEYDNNQYHTERANLRLYYKSGSGFLTSSIENVDILDGDFYNINFQRMTSSLSNNINNEFRLYLAKTKYGKVVTFQSASIYVTGSNTSSFNTSWNTPGTIRFGYDSNLLYGSLTGSVREIRFWKGYLEEDVIKEHSRAGRSYVGNNATSSYYDLQLRYILGNNKSDFSVTSSLISQHPNQNKLLFSDSSSISASFTGFGSKLYYGYNEEMTYLTPTIGGSNFLSTKVRVEEQTLIGNLSSKTKASYSDYDDQPLDSSKLVIAFSPQDVINEDIISHIGDANLDDYIGNPADVYKGEYTDLENFSIEYWKKYQNKNDFNAFFKLIGVYDFGVFEQIKQVLPQRTNKILGTLIEPNLLERNKIKTNTFPILTNTTLEVDNSLYSLQDIKSDYEDELTTNINQNELYQLDTDYDGDLETKLNETIYSINSILTNLDNEEFNLNIYNLLALYTTYETLLEIKKENESTYKYYNVKKIDDVWQERVNSKDKYSSTGSFISNYATSSLMKVKTYHYSSYDDATIGLPYSSSYSNSIFESANKLPTSIYRNRYKGCIFVSSSIDGTPAVELFEVDPTTITFTGNSNSQGGPLEIF